MRTFDFVVINDDLEQASQRFSDLLKVIDAGTFDVETTVARIMESAGDKE
jgi:hypothetical protein